ncbi:hypothetical protein M1O20_05550 [Dehalococcoidia bacterium]|nr:hypothetical protein [Dehalococcoidia bacterium]MCL0090878.1 hypothetical protein [Dehalococcoidia bacterium]
MSKILTVIVSIAIIAIIIIGLISFDLFLELWVKLLIGLFFLGAIVTLVRSLFIGK